MVTAKRYVIGFLRRIGFILMLIPFLLCVIPLAYLFLGGKAAAKCFVWLDDFDKDRQ